MGKSLAGIGRNKPGASNEVWEGTGFWSVVGKGGAGVGMPVFGVGIPVTEVGASRAEGAIGSRELTSVASAATGEPPEVGVLVTEVGALRAEGATG